MRYFYPPFVVLFFVLGIFLLLFLLIFIQIGIISYAFEKLGFSPWQVFLLLYSTLFGSLVNLPVAKLESRPVVHHRVVQFWGMRYLVPHVEPAHRVVIAVNLGGAVIPTIVSLTLLLRGSILPPLVATAIVTFVINRFARPVPGVGIAVPILIAPLTALLAGALLGPNDLPRVAYISGTLGTLIGADLLNLDKVKKLGAPVASIGGAGTFDGIFVTGILAVLFA
jgi:uncharacterized membrane protein